MFERYFLVKKPGFWLLVHKSYLIMGGQDAHPTIKFTGGQDAHPTIKFILCGTGILPVPDNSARYPL